MTKNIRILKRSLWGILLILPIFLVLSTFMTSCTTEDSNSIQPVHIDSIWTNQVDTITHTKTSSYIGVWVRLQGSGFNGLDSIICNGINCPFISTLQTSDYITFLIPSSLATGTEVAESVRNTIRIVTNHGEATYSNFKLIDKTKLPSITSISYTMPKVGDYIYLEGKYLSLTTEIYFPTSTGWVQASDFSVVNAYKVKVKVPVGAGTEGAVKIIADGATYFSPSYMFYKNGVFVHTFKEANVIIAAGTVNYYNAAQIQTLTGLTSSPDSVLAIPTTAGSVTTGTGWVGYFKFHGDIAFQNIINKGGSITGSSTLTNLAIQFDIYVNQPWKSGVLAIKMNKNAANPNADVVYNIEPWTTTTPYTFETGWRTITVPFSNFTGLTLGTLDAYITKIKALECLIGFVNSDVNADGHTATALTGYQMFISNLRLVPTTVPTK